MTHVAIVSHDAGGAEILSSWLNRYDGSASVVVAGPAEKIFQHKCPQANFRSLEEALDLCTWVLCGTGWQSSFEREGIRFGRVRGKKTVSFLDHWVHYRERFEEHGQHTLPDEIWVGDQEAERMARSLFLETPVLLKNNPYVEDLQIEIERLSANQTHTTVARILYVCEPIGEQASIQFGNEYHWGYTEYDALRFFLKNLSSVGELPSEIIIRPHPSESIEKYYWASDFVEVPIRFGGQSTLLEEILESEIVVGCESMALVVGLLAGKKVISSIPPRGVACQLPHTEIEHLSTLVKIDRNHG